jgi:hypothetical protein
VVAESRAGDQWPEGTLAPARHGMSQELFIFPPDSKSFIVPATQTALACQSFACSFPRWMTRAPRADVRVSDGPDGKHIILFHPSSSPDTPRSDDWGRAGRTCADGPRKRGYKPCQSRLRAPRDAYVSVKWLRDSADQGPTQVLVNGSDATVLFGSPESCNFLCPAADPGSQLTIVVETRWGRSKVLQARDAGCRAGHSGARQVRTADGCYAVGR